MRGWRRHVAGIFIGLYLLVQVGIPLVGLEAARQHDRAIPFSWQMFSRPMPADE